MQNIMHVSEHGLALIRRFEGFSASPYYCPAGRPTIGYGHVIGAQEVFIDDITLEQAEALLKEDVGMTEQGLARLLQGTVKQYQFDALCSFVYNIGIEAFEKSLLLSFLASGNDQKAAAEFGRWVYAGGRRLEGLIRRRAAEMALFSGKSDF